MGPVFYDSRALVASASIDVVNAAAWIYRRLPWPAQISFAADSTGAAATVLLTLIIGSDTQLGPEMPLTAGGTAGVFPNQAESFIQLLGAAGDLIKVLYRETAAATPTVNTVLKLTPLI